MTVSAWRLQNKNKFNRFDYDDIKQIRMKKDKPAPINEPFEMVLLILNLVDKQPNTNMT